MTPRSVPLALAAALLVACGDSGGGAADGSSTSSAVPATSTGVVDPTTSSTDAPTTTTGEIGVTGTGTTDASTTSSSSGDASTSTGDDTTSTSTTGESSSTGDDTSTGEPIDCAALPQGPLPYTSKYGVKASEDLAFDHEGNMIGVDSSTLFKSPFMGDPTLWVPNAGGFVAGLRMTADGVLVFADNTTSTMFRVMPGNMFKEPVLAGLEYANGLEVDLDGYVYAAEQNGGRVRRIDPMTGAFTVVTEGLNAPNGVSFSPDYKTLYVGSFGGGTITAITMSEDMTTGTAELFAANIGGGGLDGMAVDACGNVYVCDFGPAIVWRLSPDGLERTQLIDFGAETSWIPNMQWGSGVGGWDKETLYVLDFGQDRVFEVPLGVTDKPRAYP